MDYKPEEAMMIKLDYELPEYPTFVEGIRRAPHRESHLTQADKELAIKNALRYIHPDHHKQMAREFAQELEEHGRIYGYRFRPQGRNPRQTDRRVQGQLHRGQGLPGHDRQQPRLRRRPLPL